MHLHFRADVEEEPMILIHSRKLTWKPKKGPIKTTVLLKGDYMGFHVSLGECKSFCELPVRGWDLWGAFRVQARRAMA